LELALSWGMEKMDSRGRKLIEEMKGKLVVGGRKLTEDRLAWMDNAGGECRAEGKLWK
jgi:hypothetical protein